MWKWIAGGIAVVVAAVVATGFYLSDKIFIHWEHATVTAADFSREIPPAQLRADFQAMTATIERVHPDIAAITDGGYAALKARTLATLDHPMTRVEFFRALAPFIGAAYRDGHMALLLPEEEWDAYRAGDGTVPPFAIRFTRDAMIVTKSFDPAIPEGAQILSINGVSAASLHAWLADSQADEAQSGKDAYGARHFGPWVWAYGLRAPFKVSLRRADGTETAAGTKGVSFERWRVIAAPGGGEAFHLEIANGVAWLTIRDFEEPWDSYQGELTSAFQKIHDAHATAVILDLRGNNGGDTRQSDVLQTYLSAKLLPAMRQVTVKTTPEVKAAYRTLLPEGFRWIPLSRFVPMLAGIQDAPDGGTYTFSPDGSAPGARSSENPLLFNGDLYVLVGPFTYSSAVIAAAPYKFWHRATIVGETTAEPLTFFGDNYQFDLPNSKLQVHVSHKRFDLYGSKGPNIGLEPDIAITQGGPDAYALALSDIAHRRAAR